MASSASPSSLALMVGQIYRDARRALGYSQREMERRTGVAQTAQSRFERGLPSSIGIAEMERLAAGLGGRIRFTFHAPFMEDRLAQRDRVHARCIGYVATRLRATGWMVETEVEIRGSFGPGWIDVLAFHPTTRELLVIEIKTEVHHLGRTQRTLAWYESQAPAAARAREWQPQRIRGALLFLATAAVDRGLESNRDLLAHAFPLRASGLQSFIEDPGSAQPHARGLALIDPLNRRAVWLRPTRLDGRRSAAPHVDYGSVVRALEARSAKSRRAARPRVIPEAPVN